MSRLLALFPSLDWIYIETEPSTYSQLWVPWYIFEELAFGGDALVLELGDLVLERLGYYDDTEIIIELCLVTTPHEDMYEITSQDYDFDEWNTGPMNKIVRRPSLLNKSADAHKDVRLNVKDRDVLWKQFGTTASRWARGYQCRWENVYRQEITFEYFIAMIAPEDQRLGFLPTEYDFPEPINWDLPLK